MTTRGHRAAARRCLLAGVAILVQCGSAGAAEIGDGVALNVTGNPEGRYINWQTKSARTGDVLSTGHQFYLPFASRASLGIADIGKLGIVARSGYVATQAMIGEIVAPDGLQYGEIGRYSGLTDTSVTGTVVLMPVSGIQPFASLGMNIPTGRTILTAGERTTLTDSDIVQIPTYGQGTNVAPTVGANIPIWSNLVLSGSVGWVRRGAFQRANVTRELKRAEVRVDPSDAVTYTGSIGFDQGPVSISFTASQTRVDETRLEGVLLFRSGVTTQYATSIGFAVSPLLEFNFEASNARTHRNSVRADLGLDANMALTPEQSNSNSSVWRVSFGPTIQPVEGLKVSPTVSLLRRDQNDWSDTDARFVPAKSMRTFGLAADYVLNAHASLKGSVERSTITEAAHPNVADELDTKLWMYSLGGTVKF